MEKIDQSCTGHDPEIAGTPKNSLGYEFSEDQDNDRRKKDFKKNLQRIHPASWPLKYVDQFVTERKKYLLR